MKKLSRRQAHFLTFAMKNGIIAVINHYRKKGIDIGGFTVDSLPAIVFAAQQRQYRTVKYYIEQNVYLYATTSEGITALIAATIRGNYKIVELLLKNGYKPDHSTDYQNGCSPLSIATIVRGREIMKLLLRYGANVNIRNHLERTPLMIAAGRNNSTDEIKILLENNADIYLVDRFNLSALDIARKHNQLDALNMLSREVELHPTKSQRMYSVID